MRRSVVPDMIITACLLLLVKIVPIFSKLNGEGKVCGRAIGTNLPEEKIVAGYDVGYYKYPWYAALIISNVVACGGTLVGSRMIISAAHCYKEYITGHDAKKTKLEDVYNVTLGIYNRCEKEKTQRVFPVEKVHIHEKYKENIPYFDISLLILKENANYEPICLPKSVIKTRPREGSVPGLGTLRYHGSTPCTLHEARLLVYSDYECKKMLNRTGNDPNKLIGAFCAGYLQGGIDTCQGDSGGPFQIMDEFGNHILLGVVSFGFHCANPNLLGVYTDVSHYVNWIEEKSGIKTTMEASNSTSDESTEPAKPPPRPNPVQVVHQNYPNPGNVIIIIRNRNKIEDKRQVVRKKHARNKQKAKKV
ncbi:acyl-CoA desaturase 1 isoform X1 [Tribolium castaneum]|uniref:acyl-CoA desaturase 1 isoform X1 n=1 Tax=Tribolium castaneum TaxID=7070 RepID=UPI00077DE116|nr:PREDICTED: trypsin-1 isoform X1 [Tribolium castaneum]|eukprot:XP_008201015.2 PREDICTED: trypsin-1 isoform X1 [Tribolium castaneum]